MSEKIEKLDSKTIKAIRLQAVYNRKVDPVTRIEIAMEHLEGLKELKGKSVRK